MLQVNHTWADWETPEEWEEAARLKMAGTPPVVETCVANRSDNVGHENIQDGPFLWDGAVEVGETEEVCVNLYSPSTP